MFATAIAGSLPKPACLAETGKLCRCGRCARSGRCGRCGRCGSPKASRSTGPKLDATLMWIKAQEEAGLSVIGGGEQSRQHLIARTHCGLAPMRRAVAESKLAALAAGARLADQCLAAAAG